MGCTSDGIMLGLEIGNPKSMGRVPKDWTSTVTGENINNLHTY
jgi:hypothetical protein